MRCLPLAYAIEFGERINQSKLHAVEAVAVYSFATLKLLRTSRLRSEILDFIQKEKIKKCILVSYDWGHARLNSNLMRRRLEFTPDLLSKRLKHSKVGKKLHWNHTPGVQE